MDDAEGVFAFLWLITALVLGIALGATCNYQHAERCDDAFSFATTAADTLAIAQSDTLGFCASRLNPNG